MSYLFSLVGPVINLSLLQTPTFWFDLTMHWSHVLVFHNTFSSFVIIPRSGIAGSNCLILGTGNTAFHGTCTILYWVSISLQLYQQFWFCFLIIVVEEKNVFIYLLRFSAQDCAN